MGAAYSVVGAMGNGSGSVTSAFQWEICVGQWCEDLPSPNVGLGADKVDAARDHIGTKARVYVVDGWAFGIFWAVLACRGKVTHVPSSETRYFREWQALFDFLVSVWKSHPESNRPSPSFIDLSTVHIRAAVSLPIPHRFREQPGEIRLAARPRR